jgi:hypothetical protein
LAIDLSSRPEVVNALMFQRVKGEGSDALFLTLVETLSVDSGWPGSSARMSTKAAGLPTGGGRSWKPMNPASPAIGTLDPAAVNGGSLSM